MGAKGWRPTAGSLLRADLWRDSDSGGIKLLVEQVCRVADRLEQLARVNCGDVGSIVSLDWGRVLAVHPDSGEEKLVRVEVALRVDAAVSEERQQAKLFASLLADIARQRAALPPAPAEGGSGERTGDLAF